MYIEKRWLFPTMLSVLLLAGISVVVALALRPVQTRAVQLRSLAPIDQPVCAPAPSVAVAAPAAPAAQPVSRRDTQINTGGFGDIGMQFQNSDVNAPISNAHISNNGDGNNNNVNVGQGNMIFQDNSFSFTSGPVSDSQPQTQPPATTPTTTPTTSGTTSSTSSSSSTSSTSSSGPASGSG
jgi:hypothetical protein